MIEASVTPTVSVKLATPPAELGPNSPKRHWREKQPFRVGYGNACYTDALKARRLAERAGVVFPLVAPVTMVVTFVFRTRRRRDFDNCIAAFKSGQDSLVKAGLIVDDDVWRLRVAYQAEVGARDGIVVELWGAS